MVVEQLRSSEPHLEDITYLRGGVRFVIGNQTYVSSVRQLLKETLIAYFGVTKPYNISEQYSEDDYKITLFHQASR